MGPSAHRMEDGVVDTKCKQAKTLVVQAKSSLSTVRLWISSANHNDRHKLELSGA